MNPVSLQSPVRIPESIPNALDPPRPSYIVIVVYQVLDVHDQYNGIARHCTVTANCSIDLYMVTASWPASHSYFV